MHPWLFAFLLSAFAMIGVSSAEIQSVTLFVQFIRGTNAEKPEETSWKPIGPKLEKRLLPVFQWRYYWEVNWKDVKVEKGKVSKVHLNASRSVEIELVNAEQMEIRIYRKGALSTSSRRRIHATGMEIFGGTRDDDTCWFVVVRPDKPNRE